MDRLFYIYISVAQKPKSGLGLLIIEVSRSHTIRHTHTHTHKQPTGIFERMISTSQRPLPSLQQQTKRRTSMPSAGSEPAVAAIKRPQTYVENRTAIGIGRFHCIPVCIYFSITSTTFYPVTMDTKSTSFGVNVENGLSTSVLCVCTSINLQSISCNCE